MLTDYQPIAEKYGLVMPDLKYLSTNRQGFERDFASIPNEVQNNYQLYLESLKAPMPFYLGTPKDINGHLNFNWDEAYDFNGGDITYHFVIAKDPLFSKLVVDGFIVNVTDFEFVSSLKPGEYYWKVIATNPEGKTQLAFDNFFDKTTTYSGIKHFMLTPDGQVLEK